MKTNKFDFIKRNKKMIMYLKLAGCWYMDKNNIWAYLYNIYAFTIFIYYLLLNIAQTMNIYKTLDNIEEISRSALITFTEGLTGLKAYLLVRQIKTIRTLNKRAKDRLFQPKTKAQYDVINSTFYLFDKMYLLHSSGPMSTIIVFSLLALIERNYQLPFPAWYPYNIETSPNYELTFIHYVTASFIMAVIQINIDCLCAGMICLLVTQIDLLILKLKDIGQKNGSDTSFFYKELIECIQHHQKILEFQKDLNTLLSGVVCGQYFLSVTTMCVSAFALSLTTPGSSEFIACIVYATALLVQLFLYCWWGNQLYFKSQEIPMAAFHCHWLNTSTKFKKDLIFFIRRTQKPIELFTLNFFQISLESFKVIIKNSYSIYAVLQHVNSKREPIH